jgi:hypothetical protein
MAGEGIRFGLNTTEQDAKWIKGGVLDRTIVLSAQDVRAAVERSMQPGLMALQRNVQQVPARSGRLRKSPAILTRKYGRAPFFKIVGLVGYRSGVAPHARYLEMGTPPRAGRGLVKAGRMAWSAFFANKDVMGANITREMESLVQKAVNAVR